MSKCFGTLIAVINDCKLLINVKGLSPQSQSGSKWIHGEVMCFEGEVTTSKWTHGEVAVFGSTLYTKFSRLNAKSLIFLLKVFYRTINDPMAS